MPIVKLTGFIAWVVGISVFIGLAIWSGAALAGQALVSIGWGIVLVVAIRTLTIGAAGIGWWRLFPAGMEPALRICMLVRFVREAANAMLPLAQVGGDLIGARVLTFFGVPGPLSAASIVVDLLLQAGTQFLFALFGLGLLMAHGANDRFVWSVATGLAVAAPALAAFYGVQRRGGQRILRFIFNRLAGDRRWAVLGTVDAVYKCLTAIYANPARLTLSVVIHSAGWIVGAGEVLIALSLMGHSVSVAEALIIESLMHAARGAAFAIPGALGVQEGALIALCAIFGIPPDQALALSLAKRAADIALGVPGLIGWQVLEGARWRRTRPVTTDRPPA